MEEVGYQKILILIKEQTHKRTLVRPQKGRDTPIKRVGASIVVVVGCAFGTAGGDYVASDT